MKDPSVRPRCMFENSVNIDKVVMKVVGDKVQQTEDVLVGEDGPMGEEPGEDIMQELFGDAREGDGEGPVEEAAEDETAAQDSAPKRVAPDPGQPTQSEIDEHNVDHWPYRCWCEHCVRGRGIGEPHVPGPESRVPVIAFDYLFITQGKILKKDELSEEDKKHIMLKILVVKDTKSRAIFAHAVRQKGVDDEGYAVTRVTEDVRWLGYTKLILKTDGERAIVRLLKESLKAIKTTLCDGVEQASFENPPTYDPRSNGSVENAVKAVKGMLRTLKSGLEERMERKVPDDHPVMTWLVEHAAWILTTRPNGEDGQTPFQRVRGRPFTKRAVEFGERVLYKLAMKGPRHDERGELHARWGRGLMLGYSRFSNEYMLWNGKEAIKARAIQRMKRDLRWHREGLEKISVDVHSKYPAAEMPGGFDGEVPVPPARVEERGRAPRTVAVRQADWIKHGSTPRCPKCAHAEEHGWGLKTGPHSAACIERFRKIFAETDAGRQRLAEADQRRDAWLAKQVQEAVERPREDAREVPQQFEPLDRPTGRGQAQAQTQVGSQVGSPVAGDPNGREDAHSQDGMEDVAETPVAEDDDMELPEYLPTSPEPDRMEEDEAMLQPLMAVVTEDVKEAIKDHDAEILKLVKELGGSTKAYGRERRRAVRAIVAEIYSPPRVTSAAKLLPGMHLTPGFALDLTTVNAKGEPWDFDDDDKQDEALRLIDEIKPLFVVGSPMCTAFSTWQRLSAARRDPKEVEAQYQRALKHLRFACQVYRKQLDAGRYFLHEHPVAATSWAEPCMMRLRREDAVQELNMDQCQFNQKDVNNDPIKKPTKWLTNCPEVLKTLDRRCGGRGGACSKGGMHQVCAGSRARRAAIYPFALCRAILKGFRNQLRVDGYLSARDHGVHLQNLFVDDLEQGLWPGSVPEEESEETADVELNALGRGPCDAITGQPLDPVLVAEARKKELEYFETKGVWHKRPRAEAYRRMGKPPITVKWVDVNKGDDLHPNYRSRLVAREIRRPGEDSIFAPTPPLESLRTVLSMATTDFNGEPKHVREDHSEERTQISVIDISRAYFNARKEDDADPTYVELPDEDADKKRGMAGLLRVHMYGTRAAAEGWHGEYSGALERLGFARGDASACVFRHGGRRLVTSVHGDDFTTAGPKKQLDWLKKELEKCYELKENYRIGPGAQDAKEARVLNRVIRWTARGVEYEADPRQAERLILDLGLEGAKTVGTAGVKPTKEAVAADKALATEKQTAFRGVTARGNYLAADRPDVQYATKEICRWMAQPSEAGLAALKRLGRYLEGHKRMIIDFPYQAADKLDVYSDTDWSGCIRTRKSTSGGCLMVGKHLMKSWSSTQGPISLSSGEAEFYGVVKASGVALGYQALLRDLGVQMPIRVWTDSSATMGICSRQGLGKLRHVDTRSLWVQQRVRDGTLELRKVRGEVNPADVFTKHLSSEERVKSLLGLFGCRFASGRAAEAPALRRDIGCPHEGILACEMVYALAEEDLVEQDGYKYPAAIIEATDGGSERVPDAYLHDVRVLPHEVQGDLNEVFPKAHAAPALDELVEEEDPMELRGVGIGVRGRQ